jgi:uncharacterized protein YllA (UPF0747 family)
MGKKKSTREKLLRWLLEQPASERVVPGVTCGQLLQELLTPHASGGDCPACGCSSWNIDSNIHECDLCFDLAPAVRKAVRAWHKRRIEGAP